MPRPYPEPAINQSVDIMLYANEVSGGWFGIMFSLVLYIVAFTLAYKQLGKFGDAGLTAGVIAVVLTSFLWVLGIVAGKIVIFWLCMALIAAIYSFFEK